MIMSTLGKELIAAIEEAKEIGLVTLPLSPDIAILTRQCSSLNKLLAANCPSRSSSTTTSNIHMVHTTYPQQEYHLAEAI